MIKKYARFSCHSKKNSGSTHNNILYQISENRPDVVIVIVLIVVVPITIIHIEFPRIVIIVLGRGPNFRYQLPVLS